ncbi:hypothetical protein HK102_008997 [Quaeritorhiza haematococci]|nr:hypothetical protein HK102_008997 [Quaeritorhiza haematococci]
MGKKGRKERQQQNSDSAPAKTPTVAPTTAVNMAPAEKKGVKGLKSPNGPKKPTLLSEILALGGSKDDLDLLQDVLSDSDQEGNDEGADKKDNDKNGSQNKKDKKQKKEEDEETNIDEKDLLKELQSFMSTSFGSPAAKKTISSSSIIESDGEEEEQGPGNGEENESESEDVTTNSKVDNRKINTTNDTKSDRKGKEQGKETDTAQSSLKEEPTLQKEKSQSQQQYVKLRHFTASEHKRQKLIVQAGGVWYQLPLPSITPTTASLSDEQIVKLYSNAKELYSAEVEIYENSNHRSSADKEFVSTVLKSGTVTDRVSALTLLVQEAPIHSLNTLQNNLLNGMARKKARREAILAMDSIKDLMVNTLLPDRKLKYFCDQPLASPVVTPKHLVFWYFEDSLKKIYFEFLRLIEELSRDPVAYVKKKMLQYVYELLVAKPEQEQNLLALLVNKLGDTDRSLASKSVHQLLLLLQHHPNMKLVLTKELEHLIFRPNVSPRAQYYAVTVLNQIVLSNRPGDGAVAEYLIGMYFRLFERLVEGVKGKGATKGDTKGKGKGKGKGKNVGKTSDKKRKDQANANQTGDATAADLAKVDGIDAKMMGALLTGVNRAFPFAKIDDDVFEKHINTLFTISHVGTFSTCIQALTLIFQVQSSRQALSDRFYRALYDTLLDHRLPTASKHAMYLNLLFRALKSDSPSSTSSTSTNASNARLCAFIKRIAHVSAYVPTPLACAFMYLIGELGKARPAVFRMVTESEESGDGVEKFVDVDDDDEAVDSRKQSNDDDVDEKNKTRYDPRKREPLYAHAEETCLWDLVPFTNHFHPTVSLYSHTLLNATSITPPSNTTNYDPLQNHTLMRFLDRFVYKNPKKVSTVHKGISLMQPRVAIAGEGPVGDVLFRGGKKRNVVVVEDEVAARAAGAGANGVRLDDAPVNESKWVENGEENVPVDELFFYKFFKDAKSRKKATTKTKSEPGSDDEPASDFDDEELDESEVWNAIKSSKGFADNLKGGIPDEDLEDEDDEEFEKGMGGWGDLSSDEDDGEDEEEGAEEGEGEEVDFGEEEEDEDGEGMAEDDDDLELDDTDFAEMDGLENNALGGEDDDSLSEDDLDHALFDSDGAVSEDDESAPTKKGSKTTKKSKKVSSRMKRLAEKAKRLGYSGRFFDRMGGKSVSSAVKNDDDGEVDGGDGFTFASADDFMDLIDKYEGGDDGGDGEDGDEAVETVKVGGKRKKSGPGGRKGSGKKMRSRK